LGYEIVRASRCAITKLDDFNQRYLLSNGLRNTLVPSVVILIE
jgi:hypothetical protein